MSDGAIWWIAFGAACVVLSALLGLFYWLDAPNRPARPAPAARAAAGVSSIPRRHRVMSPPPLHVIALRRQRRIALKRAQISSTEPRTEAAQNRERPLSDSRRAAIKKWLDNKRLTKTERTLILGMEKAKALALIDELMDELNREANERMAADLRAHEVTV